MGTLTFEATTVDIPDAMDWPNEFSYRLVEQKTQYSVTGALLIESAVKQAGRRIELRGADRYGAIPRSDTATLLALAAEAGAEMELEFREQTFTVVFDHEAGAIEGTPFVDFEDPDETDLVVTVLRFIVL